MSEAPPFRTMKIVASTVEKLKPPHHFLQGWGAA
jgi:hypothetical protein